MYPGNSDPLPIAVMGLVSVVVLCVLCLLKLNVLMSLIIAAMTGAVLGGISIPDAMGILCDGFSGNVLLKTMEGVGSFAGSALKAAMFKKNLLTKLAALCVMPGLNAFKAKLDPNKVGGTAFIGISRPVIKAHGSSNAEAIENAMGQAGQVARSGIIRDIEENVALMKVERE